MTITRRALADQIDSLDEQISELQAEKATYYTAYREQMEKASLAKSEIKNEIVACKAAIRRRQKQRRDGDEFEKQDALTDEVFLEITKPVARNMQSRAPALAPRPREAPTPPPTQEADDAETVHVTTADTRSGDEPPPLRAAAEADGIPDFLRRPLQC